MNVTSTRLRGAGYRVAQSAAPALCVGAGAGGRRASRGVGAGRHGELRPGTPAQRGRWGGGRARQGEFRPVPPARGGGGDKDPHRGGRNPATTPEPTPRCPSFTAATSPGGRSALGSVRVVGRVDVRVALVLSLEGDG